MGELATFHRNLHETACEAVWRCEHRWTRTFSPNAAERFWAYWFGLDQSLDACKARDGAGQKPFFDLNWTAASVQRGGVSFDLSKVEGCLIDLREGICDGTHRHARMTPACRAVLTPQIGPGGSCDHPMECGAGSTCDTGPDPFCGGLCEGGPLACGCALDEYCFQGSCFRYLEAGELCTGADRCVPTAGCEPRQARCVAYHSLGEGESCASSDYCLPELACVEGACSSIEFVAAGEVCNGGEILCRIGALCLRDDESGEQRCEVLSGKESRCEAENALECRPDLRCFAGRCSERQDTGLACQTDADCISGLCHQGSCAASCVDIGFTSG